MNAKKCDLISRQAAIEALGDAPLNWTNSDYELASRNMWHTAKLAIETVPSAQPSSSACWGCNCPKMSAQQWIPVTEHTLPNHNSVVVVCGEKGTWDFGTYRGLASTNIFFWNWKKNTVKEVHWWMYKEDALPMPWEGEEK